MVQHYNPPTRQPRHRSARGEELRRVLPCQLPEEQRREEADDQDDEKVDNKESQVERMAFPPYLRSHHSPATKALRYRARFLRPGREQKVRLPEPYLALWLLLYFRRIGVSRFTNSLAFDAS